MYIDKKYFQNENKLHIYIKPYRIFKLKHYVNNAQLYHCLHDKLAKRAGAQKVEGKWRREERNCDGDCVKSNLERVGEEWKIYI